MPISATNIITRNATVLFTTTFYDVNKNVVQPLSAHITLAYPNPSAPGTLSATVTLSPVVTNGSWTGQWESGVSGPGAVSYSVLSSGSPYAAEDGEFILFANPANIASML